MSDSVEAQLDLAAAAIAASQALLIGAGAGIGVDSGLPDFRGPQGFWNAYPPYQQLGLRFSDLANPRWFESDPAFAWGFYGHRQNLYRATEPHPGFSLLRQWAGENGFVFTSNVDGQFQQAGFCETQLYEVHGSIHWLQCASGCSNEIWPANGCRVAVDEETFRAQGELPACIACGAVSRPNILMFDDWGFDGGRATQQAARYQAWDSGLDPESLVVIELGAGTAVPTVRHESEAHQARGATLIRINPRESSGPAGTIEIPLASLEALRQLERRL